MTEPLPTTVDSYPEFRTKVFIDSNVILECLPLDRLAWEEIDSTGPILILVTPTVLSEVDAKKRDGRLGQRAREFNRLLRPVVQHGNPVVLSEGPPRVCIAAAICGRVDWLEYDELDRSEGDARIVVEILHARGVLADQRLLVSQDLNPLLIARRYGVKTLHAPESWLPAPEPNPKDREIAALKARVAAYKKSEPQFEIAFDSVPTPAITYEVEPLSSDEVSSLLDELLREHPMPEQERGPLSALNYDHTLEKRYAKYENETLPLFVREIHRRLETFYGQLPFDLVVKNIGEVRADNVIIEVRIAGGWLNEKAIVFPFRGPLPPRPESWDPVRSINFDHLRHHVDKHEFKIDRPKRDEVFSAQCEDFRHGQEWRFSGVVWVDPAYERDSAVIVKVTAANLHGEVQRVFRIPKMVKHAHPYQLVDLRERELKIEPHIKPIIDKSLEKNDFNVIEFDK